MVVAALERRPWRTGNFATNGEVGAVVKVT
jgi:hypothetical protein